MLPSKFKNRDSSSTFIAIVAVFIWLIYINLLKSIFVGQSSWTNWDGAWYDFIATQQSNVAFFPLFPYLIKVLHAITGIPILLLGQLLNTALLIGICYFALKIADNLNKKPLKQVQKVCVLAAILLFPTSFFYIAFYTEALLVFLATLAIYLCLKGKFWLGFVLIGLATATKFTAIILVPVCLVIYFVGKQKNSKNAAQGAALTILGVSGLLIFMATLQFKFGSAFAFIDAQKYWVRNDGFFIASLLREANSILGELINNSVQKVYKITRLLSLLTPFAVVWLSYIAYKKQQIWLAMLLLLVIALPLVSGSFVAILRYFLIALPVTAAYFVPKLKTKKQFVLFGVACVVSCLIMSVFCVYFLQGKVFIA